MARAGALRRWLGRMQPRHVIVGLCFLATFTAYVERVGFSIAFTSLARRVGFDEQVKGAVMSAFYWGYGVSQVR
jgi:ACS family sodium-dependent inorganic phosphate cotransporter